MILKEADDKQPQLDELEALLAHPRLPAERKALVSKELQTLRSGIKGERDSAYDIDFHNAQHPNRIVLHDLRFEHKGRVAQIDHLILNRLLDVFVLETKNYGDGVSINEQGEFSAWYGSRSYGIPSPLAQNERHIAVLKDVFQSIEMPTRLGIRLNPSFESVVLFSSKARISRPKKFDTTRVMKSDQYAKWHAEFNEKGSALQLAKMVSMETLEGIARQLLALHRPIRIDYRAKFGITEDMLAAPLPAPAPSKPAPAPAPAMPVPPKVAAAAEQGAPAEKPDAPKAGGGKLVCVECGAGVSYAVAKFCWGNKTRFGGKVYCMGCQKGVAVG